jgi:hypothetical protein
MKATIDYNGSYTTTDELIIKDIGNCSIEAANADLYFYYLIIITTMGKTYFASCGPIQPDMQELPTGYTCSLLVQDYNDKKLYKQLKFWLNNKDSKIISAKLISREDATSQFRNLGDYLDTLPYTEDYNLEDEDDDDLNDDEDDEKEDS